MSRHPIDRRTVLKGLLGGLAVSVALPPLEAFLGATTAARGGSSGFPTRFGVWFWGNGGIPQFWVPDAVGPDWVPTPLLQPLDVVRKRITIVSGTKLLSANTAPHGSGPAGLLTGDDQKNGTVTGPSIDQIIATKIGGQTRFPSLQLGVQRSDSAVSWSGPNLVNPPETSPAALYTRLFGGSFRLPGEMAMADPKIGLRRSVLDAVTGQATALRGRLGAVDKARLDQHLDGIRSLEMQIDRLQQAPPSYAACVRPTAPMADYPDNQGRPQMQAISRVMADLLAMALACDQTRVFTNMFSQPVNNTLFLDVAEGHHQLTHDEAGDQPEVQRILQFIMGEMAYFIQALDKIPEGDGTLLDHTVMLCTSDCSLGRTHSLDEYPLILAGGGNGVYKMGTHYRSSGENAASLSLSLLRTMGVNAPSFGVGAAQTSDEIGGIKL